jgi:hypothetical protein
MSWTYRVCRETMPNGEEDLSIRECWVREGACKPYSDKDLTSWTAEPISMVGESLEEIKWKLDKMAIALTKPVIDISGDRPDPE